MIIEIDGSSHLNKGAYDAYRQETLEKLGFVFMRFSKGDVLQRFEFVQRQIQHAIWSLKSDVDV